MRLLTLLLAAAALLAAHAPAAGTPAPAPEPDLVVAGLRMAGLMAVMLGGLVLALLAARRFGLIRPRSGLRAQPIQVLCTVHLGMKQSLALVEVAGQYLLLALSPQQLTLLGHLDHPDRLLSVSAPPEQVVPALPERAAVAPAPSSVASAPVTSPALSPVPAPVPSSPPASAPGPSLAAPVPPASDDLVTQVARSIREKIGGLRRI